MFQQAYETARRLRENMEKVVLGKSGVIRSVVVSLLAGEHLLLEDVPGVGKTLVAKALAASIDTRFSRIQFTPDLLPSDITGSSIYRSDAQEFHFTQGPIFANVVLADEINRAPPRTQSALLEAMSDRQVSVDGKSYALPQPFIVVATQNPFEFEGTYVLPESQMDRFLMRIDIGYPAPESERRVLESHRAGEPVESIKAVVSADDVVAAQGAVRSVRFDDSLQDYLLEIVNQTRNSDRFRLGVSTRAAISLYRACQAQAITDERDFVTPDDVKQLAVPTLAHRVLVDDFGDATRETAEQRVAEILSRVPVPV